MTAPQLTQYIQGQGSVSADGLNTFQQTTNLVADLRSFVGVTGIQVFARGQSTINDGGGGSFYWNALGVGPDDGVNTIVPFGAATGVWSRLAITGPLGQPTFLTGGSGTYTTPIGARQLRIEMVGGGGGGGVTPGFLGGNGSTTNFNGITANGGGAAPGADGGAGGTGGVGAASLRIRGSGGQAGNVTSGLGGSGGTGPWGGSSGSATAILGTAISGATNSGSGGAGMQLGGGGAGEYVYLIINAPIVSYTYIVGNGGGGGTSGAGNAGNGGSGLIIVTPVF